MDYIQLFTKLYEQKVNYLICGGLAVNIYGIPRMTADIDLLVDLTAENIEKFDEVMKSLNYQPVLPIKIQSVVDEKDRKEMIKHKNLIAFSFYNPANNIMNVDVLIDTPFQFNELWKNKVIRKADETELYLVSVNDLIKMKEYANRVQDKQDIIFLKKFTK